MTQTHNSNVHKKKSSGFTRAVTSTRYLVIIPIVGLALASAMLFIFGGFSLVKFIIEMTLDYLGLAQAHQSELPFYVEIIEYVHMFLIGTVLYITAVGFFQLFIKKMDFPRWLRIQNTEELETNLIGVAVVVLAINFMSLSFNKNGDFLMHYGVGIAFPIAALGLFLGMRAWARKMEHDSENQEMALETKIELLKRQLEEMKKNRSTQDHD